MKSKRIWDNAFATWRHKAKKLSVHYFVMCIRNEWQANTLVLGAERVQVTKKLGTMQICYGISQMSFHHSLFGSCLYFDMVILVLFVIFCFFKKNFASFKIHFATFSNIVFVKWNLVKYTALMNTISHTAIHVGQLLRHLRMQLLSSWPTYLTHPCRWTIKYNGIKISWMNVGKVNMKNLKKKYNKNTIQ